MSIVVASDPQKAVLFYANGTPVCGMRNSVFIRRILIRDALIRF